MAYVINRKGMKQVLDKTYIGGNGATGLWKLEDPYILVADDLIYHFASKTYTSAYPWIAGRNVETTIPLNIGNNRDLTFGRSKSCPILENANPHNESIAVVMTCRLKNENDIISEMETIKVDMTMLARSNPKSSWFVNVVLVQENLLPIFKAHISSMNISSNTFFVSIDEDRFNKFRFVTRIKASLGTYDYVLFKDNNIRLSGFAWNTFMDLKKDAIIAGPFIDTAKTSLHRKIKLLASVKM